MQAKGSGEVTHIRSPATIISKTRLHEGETVTDERWNDSRALGVVLMKEGGVKSA